MKTALKHIGITPFWATLILLALVAFVAYLYDPRPVDIAFWDWVMGCRKVAQCPTH